jgi:hypothetical protein
LLMSAVNLLMLGRRASSERKLLLHKLMCISFVLLL